MEILLPDIFIVGINETKGFSGFNPTLPQFRGKTLIFRFILYLALKIRAMDKAIVRIAGRNIYFSLLNRNISNQ